MIGAAVVIAWAVLLLLRGGFWRADQRLQAEPPGPAAWPGVVAVIPARNEAATIGEVVAGAPALGLSGRLPRCGRRRRVG